MTRIFCVIVGVTMLVPIDTSPNLDPLVVRSLYMGGGPRIMSLKAAAAVAAHQLCVWLWRSVFLLSSASSGSDPRASRVQHFLTRSCLTGPHKLACACQHFVWGRLDALDAT